MTPFSRICTGIKHFNKAARCARLLCLGIIFLSSGGWAKHAASASYEKRLEACNSFPDRSVQHVVDTGRSFVNLPKDIYQTENIQFQTVSGNATAGYIANGGPVGEGLDASPGCWSTYYQFDSVGTGEVDVSAKSVKKGVPDYFVRFIVVGDSPQTEVNFTGLIQNIVDSSSNIFYLEINNKRVAVYKPSKNSPLPILPNEGSVSGLDLENTRNNIGKRVKVFAETVNHDPNVLSTLGNSRYYVRAVQ